MNARRLFFVVLVAAATVLPSTLLFGQFPPAPSAPVEGQVRSRAIGGPVPGLTAYLVHEILGRSAPSITDANGRFGWKLIPLRNEPYFLEIYWGTNLIYRQPVTVKTPLAMDPVEL